MAAVAAARVLIYIFIYITIKCIGICTNTIAHDGKRFNNGRPMFRDRVITVKTKSVSDSLLRNFTFITMKN